MASVTPSTRQGGGYTLLGQTANNLSFQVGTLAMDSSYNYGGDAITITGFSTILGAAIGTRSGYVFEYDVTNAKVIAYGASSGATAPRALTQIATATNLAALSQVPYIAWGFI